MATLDATVDDYVNALLQLLPPGLFWRYLDDGTRLYHLLEGMAEGFVRLQNKGLDLIEEMDPRTADEMLENWEELLGLPDPCLDEADWPTTLAERRAAAHAKYIATGGQSPAYFEQVAEALLGTNVNINELFWLPFRVGVGRMGDRINEGGSQFIWEVEAAAATPADKRAQLECMINRLKPAHTIAIFSYVL
jgi:uncharacterized protein YmfQ (DUF2313 family)